ncbi:hypothetical protein [uncultured Helicobacter sp.]|uniref:hypothetical protein n=1 Tax=uncultured Helicobacter sp. TaxID=175537 RepID=UPI00374F8344
MYHLDYLPNPPRNKEACAIVANKAYAIPNPFSMEDSKHTKDMQKRIGEIFGHEWVQFWGCGWEAFSALLLRLGAAQSALSVGFSQAAYQSFGLFGDLQKLIVPTPESVRTLDARYYFVPYVNEDVLNLNPILEIVIALDSTGREYVLFVEISALLQVGAWELIATLSHPRIALVASGERIGLMPGSGFVAHSLDSLAPYLDTPIPSGFMPSLLYVCEQLRQDKYLWEYCASGHNALLFRYLQDLLGERVGVFAPLETCLGNCLALRVFGAKARVLAQSLLLEDVVVINGMDCLLGNFRPSFVLGELGFTEAHCRELLSISFMDLNPQDLMIIAQKIAKVCTITQALEI